MNEYSKEDILKRYFGHSAFRTGQRELIDQILSGRDVLGVMPTGAGKSVCYQVPAMLLSGVTIVISPLISLMQDQVAALQNAGIPAAYLNSAMTAAAYFHVLNEAKAGKYKLIYVAPERLLNEAFLEYACSNPLSMITVDEAHCVSQWGQDFRPSYLKIVTFIETLPYRPVVSAFTATATNDVRDDISRILKQENPFVLTTGFNRENLSFSVLKPKDKYLTLKELLAKRRGQSGIIYCLTRRLVEDVCHALTLAGFPATRYHAGLEDTERRENQEDFIFDRKPVMVATNAFGMGIDKSNVSFVIHFNMPKNLEGYYQEAGRAGRDGEPADCILLYSGQDVRTNQFLIDNGNEASELSESEREIVRSQERARLKMMTYYCTTTDCLRAFILRYFGEKAPHFCGNCSSCNTKFETVDMTVESQKIVSCVYRLAQRGLGFGKTMIVDILCGSKKERILQLNLDSLSTYGILSDLPAHKVRTMLDSLTERGYLDVTDEAYPVVRLNQESARLLRERPTVTIQLPKEPTKIERAQRRDSIDGEDMILFGILRDFRTELAAAEKVPAYIIFTDASLRVMSKLQPVTKKEFLRVAGVGEKKAEKYGAVFCEKIAAYKKENGEG